MARWRLMAPHYLNTGTAEWEYNETDRTTGRPKRVKFAVPLYLNPHDPGDWTESWGSTDNKDGQIIVRQGDGQPRDIEFTGDPTPDMVPLDDEAAAISAKFTEHWRYKPEGVVTYSQSLVDEFQSQMGEAAAKPIEIPGMSDLVAIMTTQVAQNAELIRALTVRRP